METFSPFVRTNRSKENIGPESVHELAALGRSLLTPITLAVYVLVGWWNLPSVDLMGADWPWT